MSNLNEKVQNIMNEIENNISNENEKEFINKKIAELSVAYLDEIQELSKKIENIEQSQNTLENKVNKIETSVNGIENDIYEEDFDFEIICPYCNAEFTADINSKTNIQCPECQNIIELDWNCDCEDEDEYSGCTGSCSTCGSHCGEIWEEDDCDCEECDCEDECDCDCEDCNDDEDL